MIGSIVKIQDQNSDLNNSQGEIINIDDSNATVMILRPQTIERKQAWNCIVENVDLRKLVIM